jgi:ABC-2 type transport system permease protein
MKVFAIAWVNVRRMLRERSNIFFVFIFPLALILLIGAQFGGGVNPVVGLYLSDDDQLATAVAEAVEADDTLDVIRFEEEELLANAVEHGGAQAGLFLPPGMDETAEAGDKVAIGFVSRSDGFGPQIQSVVGAAISEVMAPVAAAQFAMEKTGASFDDSLEMAKQQQPAAPGLTTDVATIGEALFPETLGRFDLGASSQLVLFVFLTALAGSASLILSRQLGISRRMLSTPTTTGTIVIGEGTGRWSVAMVQGLYIIVATFLIFQVNWGDPLGAFLLLVTFSAVGAGAGMLMGAIASNDAQASGIGIVLSLGLAALGGCMLPVELFSPTMQKIAHITPHAWALDGFAELVRRSGTVVDILPQLAILTAYAVVLLILASWRLRITLTRA